MILSPDAACQFVLPPRAGEKEEGDTAVKNQKKRKKTNRGFAAAAAKPVNGQNCDYSPSLFAALRMVAGAKLTGFP